MRGAFFFAKEKKVTVREYTKLCFKQKNNATAASSDDTGVVFSFFFFFLSISKPKFPTFYPYKCFKKSATEWQLC